VTFCPACGEPLDDFAPCACSFDVPARVAPQDDKPQGGMRRMVARKLARQAAEKKTG
jgi:hypothetical protein